MTGIALYFAWYSIKTRQKLEKKYVADLAALRKDNKTFKDAQSAYIHNEITRLNQWSIVYSQANDTERKERSEELKRQCMEAISDAENRLDVSVKNTQSLFTGSVQSLQFALDSNMQYLIKTLNRMDELEENLKKASLPESAEQSPEINIPPT